MRKNTFLAFNHIRALNDFKQSLLKFEDVTFTESRFRKGLKKCGIPSNSTFFCEFKKSGLIIRVGRGLYSWKDSNPIHFKLLDHIYENYSEKTKRYKLAYQQKVESKKMSNEEEIQSAINLLKEKGYLILAPKGDLYQFLG